MAGGGGAVQVQRLPEAWVRGSDVWDFVVICGMLGAEQEAGRVPTWISQSGRSTDRVIRKLKFSRPWMPRRWSRAEGPAV